MSVNNRSHGIGVGGEALFSPSDTSEEGINNYLNNFAGLNPRKIDWNTGISWLIIGMIGIAVWLLSQA